MRLNVTCALLAMTLPCLAASDRSFSWRGDGSGRFPDADPPITWGRVSKAIQGLRFHARRPMGTDAAGKVTRDGVVREWLTLGPVPVPEVPKAVEQDTFPNELEFTPDQGDKTQELRWQAISADSTLNFTSFLGTNKNSFAYAHTYIHSETGGDFTLALTHRNSARVIVNGKQVYASQGTSGSRISLHLLAGWNRLLLKVAADEDGQWWAAPLLYAHAPRGYDENNIAWMRPLPGAKTYFGTPAGTGGPIIVGDKIFLLCEPHDLFCLNKEDGKILWVRSNTYFDALSDAEKNSNPAFKEIEPLAAKWNEVNTEYLGNRATKKTTQEEREKLEKNLYDAMKKIDRKRFNRPTSQDVGYAGFTPASDGKYIYAWFASGVSACYDLDGNRQWIRLDNHQTVEHGFSSSPVLAGDKFVAFMRDLMAFDVRTGREAWRNPVVGPTGMNPGDYFHGSCLSTRLGGVETVILPNATLIRASDGKILFKDQRIINKQQVASPVLDGDILCVMTSLGETLYLLRLPQAAAESLAPTILKELKIPTGQFPYYYMSWHIASPLVHDGLVYLMNNSGVLTVVDEKTGTFVYQRMLDLDHFENANEGPARGHGVSPALAGKHLYFFGNSGAAVVLEPGRQFRQVAKNKIEGLAMPGTWGERQDRAVACLFFDGKRIYYRTESGLYALGR